MLEIIGENLPVLTSVYGLAKTSKKVYNSTSVLGGFTTAIKGIALDCAPPQFKYPLKCSILLLELGLCATTGHPLACGPMFMLMEYMVESK